MAGGMEMGGMGSMAGPMSQNPLEEMTAATGLAELTRTAQRSCFDFCATALRTGEDHWESGEKACLRRCHSKFYEALDLVRETRHSIADRIRLGTYSETKRLVGDDSDLPVTRR
eukprot:Hpha_TRINITY_DN2855_c0_g1::TRINITY_DN2855_c0_g1_i1::g.171271::m.171271